MATPFLMTRDIAGYNGFGLAFSDTKSSIILALGTDSTLPVPSTAAMGAPSATKHNKFIAIFSIEPGAKVWVALNQLAETPAGTTFASTGSELNPSARAVQAGDVLHFITGDTSAQVGVAFYALY